MPNAAHELVDLLESWGVPAGHGTESGRPGNADDLEYWHNHNRALELLVEVERFVNERTQLDRVIIGGPELLRRCYHAIYGWNPRWGAGAPSSSILDEMSAGMLKMIGDLMEVTQRAVEPDAAVVKEIGDRLAEVRELLDELGAGEVPGEMWGYLAVLLAEAESALADYGSVGYLPLRSKVTELGGLVVSISLSEAVRDPETRGRLARVGFGLLANVAGNVAAVGVLAAAEQAVRAIGG